MNIVKDKSARPGETLISNPARSFVKQFLSFLSQAINRAKAHRSQGGDSYISDDELMEMAISDPKANSDSDDGLPFATSRGRGRGKGRARGGRGQNSTGRGTSRRGRGQ